jgi:hypothetical protein
LALLAQKLGLRPWNFAVRAGTVAPVIDSFDGKLTLSDGSTMRVRLNIGIDNLSVASEGISVGTWPLKYCRVSRISGTEFNLIIDGDRTVFVPQDPVRFAREAAHRFSASSLADRINVIKDLPLEIEDAPAEPEEPVVHTIAVRRTSPVLLPRIPLVVAGSLVAVAALVTIAGLAGKRMSSDAPATTVGSTVTFEAFPGPEFFVLDPATFADKWNEAAVDAGGDYVVDVVRQEQEQYFSQGRLVQAWADNTIELVVDAGLGGDLSEASISFNPRAVQDEVASTVMKRLVGIVDSTMNLGGRSTYLINSQLAVFDPASDHVTEPVRGLRYAVTGSPYWLTLSVRPAG